MEQKIVALEERVLFLERHIEELDGVVRELYERFDALRGEVSLLREDTQRQIDGLERSPEDDVPPHWGGAS